MSLSQLLSKHKPHYKRLSWILGDQLNYQHSWFDEKDSATLYVMAELREETDYCRHHIQKVCAFFAAMRTFAAALKDQGHEVLYLTLDDSSELSSLEELIQQLCHHFEVAEFYYQRPDEIRLLNSFRQLQLGGQIQIREFDTEHFLLPFDELNHYVKAGKHNRMESFYRKMRKRFDVLMNDSEPVGGSWNFDTQNRNKLKKSDLTEIPAPLVFANNVIDILALLDKHGVKTFGSTHSHLVWPVSRQQSLSLLNWFCSEALQRFGKFQDSMTRHGESKWSLYHSRLSFAINSKMLSPAEVIDAAIRAFETHQSTISLAQIEGFVRQILGWREYIRAVYWVNGAQYKTLNHFAASEKLPDYFWTGKTNMRCLAEAIGQSLEFSYAHHIQRLMVTGNFCMLAGIDPDQVDDWYLGIYVDAIEWVEQPNTRGMSQFADGGLVATKPYAASGNYINKMSDYCSDCHYQVKQKIGEDACPINSLYWRFMVIHRQQLSRNPRVSMLYKTWDKMDIPVQDKILATASENIKRLEKL